MKTIRDDLKQNFPPSEDESDEDSKEMNEIPIITIDKKEEINRLENKKVKIEIQQIPSKKE